MGGAGRGGVQGAAEALTRARGASGLPFGRATKLQNGVALENVEKCPVALAFT